TRTPPLPGPLGRTAVQPGRPGQPLGDRRTGAALGGGAAGTPGRRRALPTRAAAPSRPRGAQSRGPGGLSPSGKQDPRTVATGPFATAAAEGLPALPDRQGRRPPHRSGYSSGPYSLEGRRGDGGRPAGDGGFLGPAVVRRNDGEGDPQPCQTRQGG